MAVLTAVAVAILLPLAVTIVLETAVAALFGLRRQALTAVVWVNFVTNPPLNLLWLVLAWVGIGFARSHPDPVPGWTARPAPTFWGWLVLCCLEVFVIVAEWRLLVWALGRQNPSSRRLMVMSTAMNVVSAVLGTFVLTLLVV